MSSLSAPQTAGSPVPDFSDQTFRGAYSFRNSPAAIRRFPYPFAEDRYAYSMNVEPHLPGPAGSVFEHLFDIDEHYAAEVNDRAIVLRQDPSRCLALPHMMTAQWDMLELITTELAKSYPALFALERAGSRWRWINRPLGFDHTFTFGAAESLPPGPDGPVGPMEYIARQMQGDFTLLDQRDNNLWLDAGVLTSPGNWSLDFNLGMNFIEWHGPVPARPETQLFERALHYLMGLRVGAPVRRLNWSTTVEPRLDTGLEAYPDWGRHRQGVTRENLGEKLHMRIELQSLYRLPRSNAILFSIRCYLLSLADLVTVPGWGPRFAGVLQSLPPEIVAYKGLAPYIDPICDYLAANAAA